VILTARDSGRLSPISRCWARYVGGGGGLVTYPAEEISMMGRKSSCLLIVFVSLCIGYWLMVHEERNTKNMPMKPEKLFTFAAEDIVYRAGATRG